MVAPSFVNAAGKPLKLGRQIRGSSLGERRGAAEAPPQLAGGGAPDKRLSPACPYRAPLRTPHRGFPRRSRGSDGSASLRPLTNLEVYFLYRGVAGLDDDSSSLDSVCSDTFRNANPDRGT